MNCEQIIYISQLPVIYSLIAGEGTVTCLNFTGVECNTFSLCLYFVETFSWDTRSGFLRILLQKSFLLNKARFFSKSKSSLTIVSSDTPKHASLRSLWFVKFCVDCSE